MEEDGGAGGIFGEVLACRILGCSFWPHRPVNHEKRLKAYSAMHPNVAVELGEIKKLRETDP